MRRAAIDREQDVIDKREDILLGTVIVAIAGEARTDAAAHWRAILDFVLVVSDVPSYRFGEILGLAAFSCSDAAVSQFITAFQSNRI